MSAQEAHLGPGAARNPAQGLARWPWRTQNAWLRERFGRQVRKVPLDLGGTCPNRKKITPGPMSGPKPGPDVPDGCAFCGPDGAGTGLSALPLTAQWDRWRAQLGRKYPGCGFAAYLQAYAPTCGAVEQVADLLDELAALPDNLAVFLAARPDCLDAERLALLVRLRERLPEPGELWLEMGLQTANDATLAAMNRGHDAACFADAVRRADAAGLAVCAHLILGLPGETLADCLATADFVNQLPVRAVKLHNFYVADGSALAAEHALGRCAPPDMGWYVDAAARVLARLRPEIIICRVNADPPPSGTPGGLVAPAWAARKNGVREAVRSARLGLSLDAPTDGGAPSS